MSYNYNPNYQDYAWQQNLNNHNTYYNYTDNPSHSCNNLRSSRVKSWIKSKKFDNKRERILLSTLKFDKDIDFKYYEIAESKNNGWPEGNSSESEFRKRLWKNWDNDNIINKHFLRSTKIENKRINKNIYQYPRMRYYSRTNETKYHYHKWGQRKILMTEIRFLTSLYFDLKKKTTKYSYNTKNNNINAIDTNFVIAYPGAAPGMHIPLVADLFPSCKFELYDPATVCRGCKSHSRIHAKQVQFGLLCLCVFGNIFMRHCRML